MKSFRVYALLGIFFCSCAGIRPSAGDDKKIEVTFLQVNDVYEIAPLENGTAGGMARVAALKKKLLVQNTNTRLIIAGDFLSPSVYNSLQFEGKRIRGRQMIEAMDAAGVDIAVFGNHEFDITESELQSRLNESRFKWISSNSFHKKGTTIGPFTKFKNNIVEPIKEYYLEKIRDADGTVATIGFIGITLPFNKAAYVSYTDPLATAITIYNKIKDSCNAVVAITHQSLADDILLAQKLPGLALIIGGHEHDRRFEKIGNVLITKAHANAKSAYVLNLRINTATRTTSIQSSLQRINESIAFEPFTDSVVKKWTGIADNNYALIGFNPGKIIKTAGEPLDGRETEVRKHATNLSRIIVAGIEGAAPLADLAVVNAGSIRVDDILQMPVSEYDILRSLPFGGSIAEADMKGYLLIQILETGRKNVGTGGFLHYSPTIRYSPGAANQPAQWFLKDHPVDSSKTYRVALSGFLLTGGEANMEFLKPGNPAITKVYEVPKQISDPRSDIRLAVIRYMENR